MFLEGTQDNWLPAEPRPLWLWVKDAIGLMLVAVCAVTLPLLLWALMMVIGL